MNNTQRAIELAKKVGYETTVMSYDDPFYPYEQIFLDPLFWQSLGKNLNLGCGFDKCPSVGEHKKCWNKLWYSFIGTLAEGKTTEDFFTQLLANK